MAVTPPWSVPLYASVTDAATPPWGGPVFVTVDTRSLGTPPWSAPAQVVLFAPDGFDWRPVVGPKIRLPTPTGWVHGRAYAPMAWDSSSVDSVLAEPVFEIAHHGFGDLRPEMTMLAYNHAARLAHSLEVSVVASSDGYFVCSHDDSTLRVTGVDLYIPTTPWKNVLENLNVNWNGTDTPTNTTPAPLCILDEVVEAFGRTHVLWIQPKRDIDAQPLVQWLNQRASYIDNQHAIIKLWRGQYPYATYAKANGGWQSWGIWLKTNRMAWMEYFDILGQEWDASQENWNGLLATGKRVVGHILETTAQRDTAITAGATGLMSKRPLLHA